jgi:hypothetical protein
VLLVVERLPHDPLLDPPETLVVLRARNQQQDIIRKPKSNGKQSEEQSSSPSSKRTIFHSGSMPIATSMNSLSRNGTRTSRPQAEVALLARRQSYWCRAFTCRFSRQDRMPSDRDRMVGGARLTDAYLAAGLLVELLLVGREVEVEVAAQELVGALPREHHLDAQRLDLARHQEHGRAGPDRRHVVGLVVIYHLLDRVDPVLGRNWPKKIRSICHSSASRPSSWPKKRWDFSGYSVTFQGGFYRS